jgi:tetratricopeptide (TPR) repeat protein
VSLCLCGSLYMLAYLEKLGLPADASREAIISALAAQEARCRVLLKIPVKRNEGAARLELIATVRELLDKDSPEDIDYPTPSFPRLEPPLEEIYDTSHFEVDETAKIFESEPVVDEGGLGEIRGQLNRWASSIPHHEYLTFGNEIEIISACRHPIYFIRYTVLTESRSLGEKDTPYQGEPLPAGTPINADAVSVWSVSLPERRGYEAGSFEQQIPASRRRVDCPQCQKQGQMWCKTCQSTGMILCSYCKGRYQFSCSMCRGSGKVAERAPANRSIDCPQCRGAGVTLCGSCRDGWSQCGACRGYRRLSCTECAGRGELLRSLYIEVDYRQEKAAATLLPAGFPDYAQKRFSGANYETASAQVLRLEYGPQLENNSIEEIENEALRTKIESITAETAGRLNGGKERRICRQTIEVRFCPAVEVKYIFEERSYELWIIGDSGDIYCRTSPVHEYDQKLARQAAAALSTDDLQTCMEKLENGFRHTPNSAGGLVVLNDSVKRLEEYFRNGLYDRVSKVAALAVRLLGPEIAVNLARLRARAISRMRFEYAIAALIAGVPSLAVALILLGSSGDLYARDITLGSSLAILLIATPMFSFLLAPVLGSRSGRILTAVAISMVAILASSLFGLVVEQDYISDQKREALARFGSGDYESAKAAIEPLESALWAAPRDFELQLMLGRAYVRANYYEKAIQSLTVALDLSGGKDAEVHNELGLALLGKDDRAAATAHFLKAIRLRYPDTYENALYNLGRSLGMVYLTGNNPVRTVSVEPFFIDRFEVTNRQYLEFTRSTGRRVPAAGAEDLPVTGLSLEDARAYASWRSEREGFAFRLAEEKEWEFAAHEKIFAKDGNHALGFRCALSAKDVLNHKDTKDTKKN